MRFGCGHNIGFMMILTLYHYTTSISIDDNTLLKMWKNMGTKYENCGAPSFSVVAQIKYGTNQPQESPVYTTILDRHLPSSMNRFNTTHPSTASTSLPFSVCELELWIPTSLVLLFHTRPHLWILNLI